MDRKRTSWPGLMLVCGLLGTLMLAALCAAVLGALEGGPASGACAGSSSATAAAASVPVELLPAGAGVTVGASEYGGPGDPSSDTIGSSGASLLAHPDSYAELGGLDFQSATAMGGLPYETPLRIAWDGRSAIAYKRDIGRGGGPVAGHPRVIDLWWQFAGALGIPYDDGEWSGAVKLERPPSTGSAALVGSLPSGGDAATETTADGAGAADGTETTDGAGAADGADTTDGADTAHACGSITGAAASAAEDGSGGAGVTLVPGSRATLLPDGQAAAPADAPVAVRGMIAAGNEIAGWPYVYGGGHGVPLDEIAPGYDCSSSVEHLLYGGGRLPAGFDADSRALERWGLPGPGRWVTIYASADHVFMYVAGLRWDTHNAAGAQDGSAGLGWHPLVRAADGFVVRHPAGL